MTMILADVAARALADALATRCNGGKLQIYDGTRPANPTVAVTTQQKLVEFVLANPAFAASAMVGANAAGAAAVATGNVGSLAPVLGLANSTATWGRIVDSSGAGVWDGSVGTDTTVEFTLSALAITTSQNITLNSMTISQPTGQ